MARHGRLTKACRRGPKRERAAPPGGRGRRPGAAGRGLRPAARRGRAARGRRHADPALPLLPPGARRPARVDATGALVPLAEQDRSLWSRDAIEEGTALITDSLSSAPLGPYQLQAAIAAVHAEADRAEDTDWPQIVALYDLLERVSPNPMITLNRAVAVAMARGPEAGLEVLATLDGDRRLADHHRLDAVRAHLLEMAGDRDGALRCYRVAARRTTSLPERRYLEDRATRLGGVSSAP